MTALPPFAAPAPAGLGRRRFLAGTAVTAGAISLGPAFWRRAFAAPAQPGPSPYGPLGEPDPATGLRVPEGFTSRVIARANTSVENTSYPWHIFPDGAGVFPAPDGGWVYVSNSESPPPAGDVPVPLGLSLPGGKVSAIRFAPDGTIVDAYSILEGSRSNCAGGGTPWGTWLSCEEFEAAATLDPVVPYDAGTVWECDPFGGPASAVERVQMGRWKHEMAGIDTVNRQIYLTEDLEDGLLYRFTPTVWGDLSSGLLEAAQVAGPDGGAVTWHTIDDPQVLSGTSTREQGMAKGATTFNGGEGCFWDSGIVYFTTKGDDRVWTFDTAAAVVAVLYDGAEHPEDENVLHGVDNIIVSPFSGDILVAEDGGNMEVCIITPDLTVSAIVRAENVGTNQHGGAIGPIPTESEVVGLAFSPDGTRLYFGSQRGNGFGINYEVRGPFRGSALDTGNGSGPGPGGGSGTRPGAGAPPTGAGTGIDGRVGRLPATGGETPLGLAGLGALAAAAAAWRARRRLDDGGERAPSVDG